MKKRVSPVRIKSTKTDPKENTLMQKNTTDYPNFKQIEQSVWRTLQETFSTVMTTLLSDLDEQIASDRDKNGIVFRIRGQLISSVFLGK
jgi:hypothetical protein